VVALFVGMNFDVKGLDAIVGSVAKVKVQRPDATIRLLVVGKGDSAKFRLLAASLGIADAVIFAGPQEGVEEFYLASDLFIMLSKFDTFGMVALEAMAARLPVILSGNVGAKDLVEEGTNGFVLPDPPDADAAAGKILLLLDAPRRAAMGEAGFRTASECSWERLAGEVGKVYGETIAEKGRASGRTVA
jgi:UDP-glucose:(heptosyl)LPS alpha-1,3-glucosyltransferase